MFYTIYKITNNLNGKFYIGKHQTKNLQDGYMGSGKLIRRAIRKYGLDNFTKEILHVYDTEEEMNTKEKELVVLGESSYNLCEGGKGGFGYINRIKINTHKDSPIVAAKLSTLYKGKIQPQLIEAVSRNHKLGRYNYKTFSGKTHTSETKRKMSLSHQHKHVGEKNSQYGTMWITNGTESKKVKKDLDFLPEGWYRGRVITKQA